MRLRSGSLPTRSSHISAGTRTCPERIAASNAETHSLSRQVGEKNGFARTNAVPHGGTPIRSKSTRKHITLSCVNIAGRSSKAMATKIQNTVQGHAISKAGESSSDKYSPDTLMRYHTTLALIDGLVADGCFTQADRRKAYTIINKKYGLSSDSIYAEIA